MREIMTIDVHIQSQIRENYGAHDWNGAGDCPQMWKCKGGEDYIIKGAPSVEDAVDFVHCYIVGDPDEYSSEELLGGSEVPSNFQTEMESFSNGELSPCRVEWLSRFEKFPPNKLMKEYFHDA